MAERLAVDLANWSVVPTYDQAKSIALLGVARAVVGTSFWQQQPDGTYRYVGDEQLAAFEGVGVETQEYLFPYRLHSTERVWWTDAEEEAANLQSIRHALSIGSAGPYSGQWFEREHFPEWNCPAEFPGARLWDARYITHRGDCLITKAIAEGGDVIAAIAEERRWTPEFVPYWGFASAYMTQWHDSIDLYGVNVDLSFYEDEEDDMPLNDEDKKSIAAIMTLQLELFRQELEKDGQLTPRKKQ